MRGGRRQWAEHLKASTYRSAKYICTGQMPCTACSVDHYSPHVRKQQIGCSATLKGHIYGSSAEKGFPAFPAKYEGNSQMLMPSIAESRPGICSFVSALGCQSAGRKCSGKPEIRIPGVSGAGFWQWAEHHKLQRSSVLDLLVPPV